MSKLKGKRIKVANKSPFMAGLKGVIVQNTNRKDALLDVIVLLDYGFTMAFSHNELRYLNNRKVVV